MILFWWRGLFQAAQRKNSKGAGRVRIPRNYASRPGWNNLRTGSSPRGRQTYSSISDPASHQIAAARSTTVPVFIDAGPFTDGAGGVQSGTFYVRYDPAVLSINETTDIQLGALLASFLRQGPTR